MEEEEGLLEKDKESSFDGAGGRRWTVEVAEEGKRLGYLSGPLVVVTLSQYLVQLVSTMIVGHRGELALSSSSIATSLSSVTGFSLLLGLASALDTLSGQAYGARQYRTVGIQMYRAMFCLLIAAIPISILWLNLGKVLTSIHQDPGISHEAERYIVWLIPGLFAYAIVQPLMKFLQAQSLIFPMLCAAVATVCLHVPLCWVLVFRSGMGNAGAALANSIAYWLNVVILSFYVIFSDSCKSTRLLPSMQLFAGIFDFLRIGIPSAVMICLEWWSFELLVLLSGLLPNPRLETSVLSICLNTTTALYTIPFGFGAATSTRVSNELGAGNPQRARVAVRVGLIVAVTEAMIVSFTIFLLRYNFGYAYSNEKEIVDYVAKITPLISISIIMDSLHGVQTGIARGCGWQHLGAYINLAAFYIFGIPLAVVLGFFTRLRGEGLWIGILCGATIQNSLLATVIFFTNWQQQGIDARRRVFGEKWESEHLLN